MLPGSSHSTTKRRKHESRDPICNDCKALAIDVLSGFTHSNDRWETLQSEQATLSYTTNHLDGTVVILRRSVRRGCQLCRLINNKVREIEGPTPACFYRIFVWDRVPKKCQVQVTVQNIKMFTEHVSRWPPLKSLVFFGRRTPMPTLPKLGNDDSTSNGDRPLLPYLPHQYPNSLEALHQAANWMEECQIHPECSRPQSRLPKRVLDLGRQGEKLRVSLYITRGEEQPYAALSYSWGETDRLVTRKEIPNDNQSAEGEPRFLVQRKRPGKLEPGQTKPKLEWVDEKLNPNDIPLDAFPRTIRHALLIAKYLGFRYVWVDSLCILQGDNDDWDQQIAVMTEIYGGSTLTISATSSQNSMQGMLSKLGNDKIGVGTWRNRDAGKNLVEIFAGNPMKTLDLEEKFISTRGWVFQERLVSTATLHYTDEGMVWECAHGTCLDHDQNISSVRWKAKWREVINQASLDPSNAGFIGALEKDRNAIWYEWINAYSERHLYDSQDKFPAIAGVAKKFAQVFGLPEGSYVAGLWKENFVAGLLWRRHNRTKTLIPLREKYVAPTWSWASVKGRLEYRSATLIDSDDKGPILKVHQYNVSGHSKGFGRLLEDPKATNNVIVEGVLQPVTVDRQSRPGVRQRPHQECGISQGFMNNKNVLCTLDEYVESAERFYKCWCLRIGSHDSYGRESDLFLLLDRVAGSIIENEFYRVGFAETDAWWDRLSPTPKSGLFNSGRLTTLTIR